MKFCKIFVLGGRKLEDYFMSQKEIRRAATLEAFKEKRITLAKAAELLELSYCQTKRIWAKYKKEGSKGLVSKRRGKKSNRAVKEVKQQEVLKIIIEFYQGCKPLFISEKLLEKYGYKYSSEFVRQLMIKHHLWVPKKSKRSTHPRRDRRESEGEMSQMDASKHWWFECRGPQCHLHILIDDATSTIYGAYFDIEETKEGYFNACKYYFDKKGLPLSVYHDKRSTFIVNHGEKRGATQFSRAMKELDIKMIFAHTPQAKGRVERAFKTLQERLVWEMRDANISTVEEANKFLPSFINKHNEKYAVQPFSSFNAHRPLSQNQNLNHILCTKNQRCVSKNLEIQYKNTIYQLITPSNFAFNLSKKKIDVIETLKGELIFEYKGVVIKYQEYNKQPHEPKKLNIKEMAASWKKAEESRSKPAPKNHPWKSTKYA